MPIGSTDPTIIMAPVDPLSIQTGATAARAPTPSPTPPTATSQPTVPSRTPALAIVIGAVAVAVGAGAWFVYQRYGTDTPTVAQAPPSAPRAPAVLAAAPKADPATLTISAVGLSDPSDPRYNGDKALQQNDARADAKSQAVEKALLLLVDTSSLAKNYDLVKDKLLANSGSYIKTVVRESEPRVGKDGLMSVTADAVVNVKALQKSLNQMSRDERVDFIRANGDPKVSVQIAVRDSDPPDAPPQLSPVAENILKERIKSFGFRTWAEGGGDGNRAAEFAVTGEAKIKRLSARLEASGLMVTKYTLTSWTVKCVDLATGEEIYYNTALPKGVGSWASEEEALKAIGAKIADEFSRDFFLQHANVTSQRVALSVEGMPDTAAEDALAHELIGLPDVIAATPGPATKPRVYDLQLGGTGSASDLVANGVLKPLNAKLGQMCFALGGTTGDKVAVTFDKRCADASILSRLDTNPPAGLYGAPLSRQKSVIKDPATLRKLTT